MPEKKTIQRAEKDKRAGKSASTQAGEFVKEQMDKIRSGKSAAKNTKQAIAIGLSEARGAGVRIKPLVKGKTSGKTRSAADRSNAAKKAARTRKQG